MTQYVEVPARTDDNLPTSLPTYCLFLLISWVFGTLGSCGPLVQVSFRRQRGESLP